MVVVEVAVAVAVVEVSAVVEVAEDVDAEALPDAAVAEAMTRNGFPAPSWAVSSRTERSAPCPRSTATA